MTNPDELERAVERLTALRDQARDGTPVTDPNEWEADRLPAVLAFEKWSADQKRKLGPFAGLKMFSRTSGRSIIIVSRHWPHLLCWQWLLNWIPYKAGEKRRLFAFYRHTNTWTLHLGCVGRLYFKRQSYDRMAALGPRWADAPVIFPRAAE